MLCGRTWSPTRWGTSKDIALGFLRAVWSLRWALRFALPGFCPQRLAFVAGCGWSLSFNVLGLLLLLGCLLFCCFGSPAPCVVFLFLLVLWSFNAGHCYWRLSFDAPGLLGCFSFFWWFSFGALGLLLSLFQLPSAASAHGLCCVLRFRSSSSSSFFIFLFPFLPLLGCLCSLWSPSCFPCLVSGLPLSLCLVLPAPPDLFLLLFLVCPQLCGVGGGGGRAGSG